MTVRYKHKILNFEHKQHDYHVVQALDEHSKEGWEAVSLSQAGSGTGMARWVALLRRPDTN